MPGPIEVSQYSTSEPMLRGYPAWIADPLEQKRIATYALMEAIYWDVPDTFKLVQRGSDADPIYVPVGRQIVEVLHRYLAPGLRIIPDMNYGTDSERALAVQVMEDLVRRERFYSKFNSNKRYGIIRGDWLWHIYADPERPEGSRLSIFELDPASYFPIYNPENVDEIIGCHIVEQTMSDDGQKALIRRLTYRKTTEKGGPSPISVSDMIFEVDDWGGPMMDQDPNPVTVIRNEEVLPSPIDQLPVYHVQNFQEPGTIYGSSEMRGLERLIAAINQGISDEELSLVLDGLGVWTTNSGTPVDDNGEEKPWGLGPGGVVELPTGEGIFFNRVSGVTNVTPFQEHLKFLIGQVDQTLGHSTVAKGRVDVQTAESGIAILLELGPLLARAGEGELTITDVHTNMLYDLRRWFVAYEGGALGGLENIRWLPTYGPKIPINIKQVFDEAMTLLTNGVVSRRWVRRKLITVGYEFDDDDVLEKEIAAEKQVELDFAGARLDQEIEPGADELEPLNAPPGDE